MTNIFKKTNPKYRNYGVILFVGLIAGIISAMVKSGIETILPPRSSETISPPIKLLMDLGANTSSEIYTYSEQVVNWGGNGVHILFSIIIAIVYCFLAEIFPKIKTMQGIIFGLVVAAVGAHAIVLPLLGLSSPVWQLNFDSIFSEIIGTCLWIWTIEIVRRDLRNRITKQTDPY